MSNNHERDIKEKKLWDEYLTSKTPEKREEIIVFYLPYVRYLCGKIRMELPSHIKEDDLISSGIEGLINSVDKFCPGRDVLFTTFAFQRIRGAIFDELRRLDWAPRTLRHRYKEIEKAEQELGHKLGRQPDKDELAEHLDTTTEEIETVVSDAKATSMFSLDEVLSGDADSQDASFVNSVEDKTSPNPVSIMEKAELRSLIAKAIVDLPESEKKVLMLYYYEDLTLKQIGEVMDVSESRVCQIHAAAIAKIVKVIKKMRNGEL